MSAGICVNILNPMINCKNMANQSQKSTQILLLFTKLLEYIEEPGNYQLEAFCGDLKRLTSLTPIPNIVLNKVKLYSP